MEANEHAPHDQQPQDAHDHSATPRATAILWGGIGLGVRGGIGRQRPHVCHAAARPHQPGGSGKDRAGISRSGSVRVAQIAALPADGDGSLSQKCEVCGNPYGRPVPHVVPSFGTSLLRAPGTLRSQGIPATQGSPRRKATQTLDGAPASGATLGFERIRWGSPRTTDPIVSSSWDATPILGRL